MAQKVKSIVVKGKTFYVFLSDIARWGERLAPAAGNPHAAVGKPRRLFI